MCGRCAERMREYCKEQKEAWWEQLEEWFEPEDGTEEDDWIEPSRGQDEPEYDSDESVADDDTDSADEADEEDDDIVMLDAAPGGPATVSRGQALSTQPALGRAVNATIAQRASNSKIAGTPNGSGQNGGGKKKKKKQKKGNESSTLVRPYGRGAYMPASGVVPAPPGVDPSARLHPSLPLRPNF